MNDVLRVTRTRIVYATGIILVILVALIFGFRDPGHRSNWYLVKGEVKGVPDWYTSEVFAHRESTMRYEVSVGHTGFTNTGSKITVTGTEETSWSGVRDLSENEFPPSLFETSYWVDQKKRTDAILLRPLEQPGALSISLPVYDMTPQETIAALRQKIQSENAKNRDLIVPRIRSDRINFISQLFASPAFTIDIAVCQLGVELESGVTRRCTSLPLTDNLLLTARHALPNSPNNTKLTLNAIKSNTFHRVKSRASLAQSDFDFADMRHGPSDSKWLKDIAVCQAQVVMKSLRHRRHPLRLPKLNEEIVVKYPFRDDKTNSFKARFSTGRVLVVRSDGSFLHNAGTEKMASGAPVVSLADGAVLGFQLLDLDQKAATTNAEWTNDIKVAATAMHFADLVSRVNPPLHKTIFTTGKTKATSR